MGYFLDKALFGRDAAIAIMAGRFIIGFLALGIIMIVAVVGVCCWIYQEIALELRYQREYGAAWQAEFERYHGSLSQAHTKILVASLCMIALGVVLGWTFWRIFGKNKRNRESRRHR